MTDKITDPKVLDREIDDARDRIKSRMKKTVQDFIEIGRDLMDVKNKLDHGEFQHWVQIELGISPRSAQNFMNVAYHLGGKSEIISLLPPTVAYALAAPSMPDDVRVRLLELAENGDLITEKMVKEHREKAASNKPSSVSEKDTAEQKPAVESKPEKTDNAEPSGAGDRLRDAFTAVLAKEGATGALDGIRELLPDPVIILADVEVADLLAALEALGREVAEEGLLRLLRKWVAADGMEVRIKLNKAVTNTGDSAPDVVAQAATSDAVAEPTAPDNDDDPLDIPARFDRRGELPDPRSQETGA